MLDPSLAVAPFERATPRDTRHRINRMEAWLARTSTDHDQARVLYLRRLFEFAYTPDHADFLADELRDLRAAAPPATATAVRVPAP